MHTNPFFYRIHQKAAMNINKLVAAGKKFRNAIIPSSIKRSVLEQEDYGMNLPAKDYNNLTRTPLSSRRYAHS